MAEVRVTQLGAYAESEGTSIQTTQLGVYAELTLIEIRVGQMGVYAELSPTPPDAPSNLTAICSGD